MGDWWSPDNTDYEEKARNNTVGMEEEASEIYLFRPTSRQDGRSAGSFIERISNAQKTYKDHARLVMLLYRCLDNEIAHEWYSRLPRTDKKDLLQSPSGWIMVLGRDFAGSNAELHSIANKEMFHWNQNRSLAEYMDEKVRKLKLAGYYHLRPEDFIMKAYEGLQGTPDLQLAMAPYKHSYRLDEFRIHLQEIEDDHRRLYELHEKKMSKARDLSTSYHQRISDLKHKKSLTNKKDEASEDESSNESGTKDSDSASGENEVKPSRPKSEPFCQELLKQFRNAYERENREWHEQRKREADKRQKKYLVASNESDTKDSDRVTSDESDTTDSDEVASNDSDTEDNNSASGENEIMANSDVQVTKVIRARKDSTIPANSAGQVALRLNHSRKADLIFTSRHAEIPNGVISATQQSVLYTNQDSKPREIKRGIILGTACSIRAGQNQEIEKGADGHFASVWIDTDSSASSAPSANFVLSADSAPSSNLAPAANPAPVSNTTNFVTPALSTKSALSAPPADAVSPANSAHTVRLIEFTDSTINSSWFDTGWNLKRQSALVSSSALSAPADPRPPAHFDHALHPGEFIDSAVNNSWFDTGWNLKRQSALALNPALSAPLADLTPPANSDYAVCLTEFMNGVVNHFWFDTGWKRGSLAC